jgi:hypothetical protein
MIDRVSRDALAQALRHYVAGLITNDDLDDIVMMVECDAHSDQGVVTVAEMAWNLYDDTYEHRATGKHAFDRKGRHEIARWIAFLYSDEEYSWPEFSFGLLAKEIFLIWLLIFFLLLDNDLSLTGAFMLGLCLCMWWRGKRRWQTFQKAGDFNVWPFLCREDLGRILPHPRLLSGRNTR